MSAATEAATAAQVGEEVAASQAAAANPARTFTAATADAAEDEEEAPGGLESVSATMLLRPAMWRISEVYSATYGSCRACLDVQGSDTLERAKMSGL